jgi:hypothetical protein
MAPIRMAEEKWFLTPFPHRSGGAFRQACIFVNADEILANSNQWRSA